MIDFCMGFAERYYWLLDTNFVVINLSWIKRLLVLWTCYQFADSLDFKAHYDYFIRNVSKFQWWPNIKLIINIFGYPFKVSQLEVSIQSELRNVRNFIKISASIWDEE